MCAVGGGGGGGLFLLSLQGSGWVGVYVEGGCNFCGMEVEGQAKMGLIFRPRLFDTTLNPHPFNLTPQG